MIGIYRIISPSGRIYIGQSTKLESRIKDYTKGIKGNFKKQRRLYNSIMKYGFINHNFEILEECNLEELNIRERFYQDLYDVISKNGLNCRLTGTTDQSGKMSEESLIRRINTLRNRKPNSNKVFEPRRGKECINIETGERFISIREAAKSINCDRQRLTDILNGKQVNNPTLIRLAAQ